MNAHRWSIFFGSVLVSAALVLACNVDRPSGSHTTGRTQSAEDPDIVAMYEADEAAVDSLEDIDPSLIAPLESDTFGTVPDGDCPCGEYGTSPDGPTNCDVIADLKARAARIRDDATAVLPILERAQTAMAGLQTLRPFDTGNDAAAQAISNALNAGRITQAQAAGFRATLEQLRADTSALHTLIDIAKRNADSAVRHANRAKTAAAAALAAFNACPPNLPEAGRQGLIAERAIHLAGRHAAELSSYQEEAKVLAPTISDRGARLVTSIP
jgi:hypothetical protein